MMKENRFKNAISYFRYHFLQSGRFILFISVIVAIISFINGINGQPKMGYISNDVYGIIGYTPTLGFSTFVLAFLCYLVPVLQFSFFKKRRNLDYIYSMPISRDELCAVHYTVGILQVYIPFTVSFLTNFLIFASWQSEKTRLLPFFGFFIWCLVFGWIFYTIFTFAFNEANTIADGCIFIGLWTFIFMLVAGRLDTFESQYFFPFIFLAEIQDVYADYAESKYSGSIWDHIDEGKSPEIHLVIWFFVIVAIAALVYLLVTFGKRRTEKAEEISDSPFGYTSMIPIYAFLLAVPEMELIISIIVTIATIVGYTMFRRGIRYKVTDLAVIGVMLLVCIMSI